MPTLSKLLRRTVFASFACYVVLFSFKTFAGENMTYWIDVRTAEEFNAGNIEGSVLIPYEVIADHIAEVTTDKNADIRVYCRSGRRSEVAKDTLKAMGYSHVINEGGYEEIIARP
jgi:phage shock protein E